MTTRILCLTDDIERYRQFSELFAVELDGAKAIPDIVDKLTATPHNGILLEFKNLMRAHAHEKKVLQEFIHSFPVLHVTVSAAGELRSSLDIDQFFARLKDFPARIVRRNMRVSVNLPVFLTGIYRSAHPPQRTHTLNLSEGGVFVYAAEDWRDDEWAWIRFVDLKDKRPVLLKLRWRVPWGAGPQLSGFGAMFAAITPEQHAMLCQRFLLKKQFDQLDLSGIQEEFKAQFPHIRLDGSQI